MRAGQGWDSTWWTRNVGDNVVSTLLAHNASFDIQDNKGLSALMQAAKEYYFLPTLIVHEADTDMLENYGWITQSSCGY